MKENYIYVIVSQTGTILSRIINKLTGAEYCHSSVGLDASLDTMYSFGRVWAYNPFWGGYVKESVKYGTFKRFSKTKAVIMRLPIDEELHARIQKDLEEGYEHRKEYGYNYIGLILAGFHKKHSRKNRFYCSEFVQDVLLRFKICPENLIPEVARPIDFLNAFKDTAIYQGSLKEYCEGYQTPTEETVVYNYS